ncbi:hypothetical protein Gogos_018477 [Gossypium gossypioides]|uniref:Uncharacterized protein n=1 Tax=Gossypium gossypioides TaxID=34282 RepID=A0A7J9BE14_GOSGO|nr:hypothetical protein [Gossypium gossypioides]
MLVARRSGFSFPISYDTLQECRSSNGRERAVHAPTKSLIGDSIYT